MKGHRKLLVAVAVALAGGVVTLGLLAFLVIRTLGDTCANTVLREVPSPGGTRKAVVFERNCGATTGFSTQVSILRAGERLPDESANLFIADTDHGRAPGGPGGCPDVHLTWADDDRLLVRHHPLARVFRAESRVNGVTATYAPL